MHLKVADSANNRRARIGLILGPLLFITILILPSPTGMPPEGWRTMAVGALMVAWWTTEAIPIAATAILPIVLFPPLGIATTSVAAATYANPTIYLFLGGFLIAVALESCGLHRRLALGVLSVFGLRPANLILGFMVATAFLSMWVSNSATVVMILPMATAAALLPVVASLAIGIGADPLLLASATALAASCGFMLPVATPPNTIVYGTGMLTVSQMVRAGFWMDLLFVCLTPPAVFFLAVRMLAH